MFNMCTLQFALITHLCTEDWMWREKSVDLKDFASFPLALVFLHRKHNTLFLAWVFSDFSGGASSTEYWRGFRFREYQKLLSKD